MKTYSPLALAYIGDAVYELIVRTKVMNHGSTQVHNMHKKSAALVNAGAQAEIIRRLIEEEYLTPEEVAAYKRGRNAKAVTTAKHATVVDYRTATGFEALCGYLYLTGNLERLITLVGRGLERIGELE
uniref:Mini-ribonuclease 3 n=1 Tax=Clostridium sp. NkU-1 TaxID=1095009 RepID=UPI000AABDE90